jgi:hypothetical protein
MADGIISAREPGIVIRLLHDVGEMNIGVDLQRRVWGAGFESTHTPRPFATTREDIGGEQCCASQ